MESQKEVDLLPQRKGPGEFNKFYKNLEKMSKHLYRRAGNQSDRKRPPSRVQPRGRGSHSYGRNPRQTSMQACWLCGEIDHFQCGCP